MWEKSTAGWLVLIAVADLVWKKNTAGWSHNIRFRPWRPFCCPSATKSQSPEKEKGRNPVSFSCPYAATQIDPMGNAKDRSRAVHIMSWTVERVYRAKFLNKPILCLSQDNFYLAVKADITRGQERAQIDDDLSGRTGRKPSKELLPFCRACSGQVAAGSNSSILVCMASVSASSSPGASPGNMTSSRSQMWLLVCRDALSMVLLLAL